MPATSLPHPQRVIGFLLASILMLSTVCDLLVLAASGDEPGILTPPQPAKAAYEVRSPAISAQISADGALVGLTLGGGKIERIVAGNTELGGCRVQGEVAARKLDGGVEFAKQLVHKASKNRCVMVERFLPTNDSIRWEIEIRGEGGPWTTSIETRLNYTAGAESRFWTTWGDPDDRRDRWQDPLAWRPLVDRTWPYQYAIWTEWTTTACSCICIPLATVAEPQRDAAMSLVLSPEDTQLGLTLKTTRQGQIVFCRSHHRLGGGRVLRFAADLVSHPADPRGGLGWLVNRYPEFFNPPNPAADQMAGCGAYSGSEERFDVSKLRRMGFRINWKCSEDFPYMGMFLPPMADAQARWNRAPDERTPGKPPWTSYQTLEDYSRWMRADGFYVLNYFNVTEYGRNMRFPPPPRQAKSDVDLWRDPHDYLFHGGLRTAVLMQGAEPVRSNCYGALVVDAGDPAYQKHLLEQARRHIEKLPDSDGLCIDRTDWLDSYNHNADDGVSWIDGKPARSLLMSWKDLMGKLGPLMHEAGKVIFINDCVCRIETMRHVDGIYAEWTGAGMAAYFNYSALLGMRKPVLVWTPDETMLTSEGPDAYLQRCLYLGVYPTAPYPINNHCLRPSPLADAAYLAYGPLLDAMRGKKWVLRPHVVEVAGRKAKANLFQVPGGYVLPVTLAGRATSVAVQLRGLTNITANTVCEMRHPDEQHWTPIAPPVLSPNGIRLEVPVKRGCAMVRLRNQP